MESVEEIKAENFGIEEIKANQIKAQFQPMLDKMDELEKKANKVFKIKKITPEVEAQAKEVRLEYVKVRTGTAEIHKKQKAFYLQAGRYVDSFKNVQLFAAEGVEARLKEIENNTAIKAAEKLEKLNNRRRKLIEPFMDLESTDLVFGAMQDDVWEAYFEKKKTQHAETLAAEKQAEEERQEAARKMELGRKRFREIAPLSDYLEKDLDSYDFEEMNPKEFAELTGKAISRKNDHVLRSSRSTELAIYSDHIEDFEPFLKMTDAQFKKALSKLEKEDFNRKETARQREQRIKALAPYMEFVQDLEIALSYKPQDFGKYFHRVVSSYEEEQKRVKDAEDEKARQIEARKQTAIIALQEIGYTLGEDGLTHGDFGSFIGFRHLDFEDNKELNEFIFNKREWIEGEKTKAENKRKLDLLQAQEDQRKREQKAIDDKKESDRLAAEKLAKAPIKKQLKAWVEEMEIKDAPVENKVSTLIEQKFEAFKKWAVAEVAGL